MGITPIMGCPTFYLLHTRRTGTAGATNWHQYLRMDAKKN
jgi:hypothetical protein